MCRILIIITTDFKQGIPFFNYIAFIGTYHNLCFFCRSLLLLAFLLGIIFLSPFGCILFCISLIH